MFFLLVNCPKIVAKISFFILVGIVSENGQNFPTKFVLWEILVRNCRFSSSDIILAATDTTSTMVEWVMAEILNNPVVMRKVQDELTQVIGTTNIVEESHLHKLTYLDGVIKETFRLHPPLPLLIQRCPDESCKVGGYTIPKDTVVYINVWAIHRDPKNWSNPLEYKPERFINGKWDYNGNNVKFLPFGSGRRICPGIPLGDKMLTYMLASLLNSFEWNLPKDEEFETSDEFGFVTKKKRNH
ncbi:putative cytochrome P450 [Helianthus annuus]|nr:putative cytochrome P450 [Helianthus annuus]